MSLFKMLVLGHLQLEVDVLDYPAYFFFLKSRVVASNSICSS